ncbi:MAG: cell division protein FtsZ [Thermoplasmata archaeon]|nr:cell division protein FtsZ [Thermoplasmata archaeon]
MFNTIMSQIEPATGRTETDMLNTIVVGCGGGGNNSLTRLHNIGLGNTRTIAVNTDMQHLYTIDADEKILIGDQLTRGHGAGGDPQLGRLCAQESLHKIRPVVGNSKLTFITAGMGGGTGTGSAPVIARAAKDSGSLVVAIVTMPFSYEGSRRRKNAEEGLRELSEIADSVIVLENDKLLKLVPQLPLNLAFGFMDHLVATIIKEMVDAITRPSLINIDFADIKTILGQGGVSTILCGEGPPTQPEAIVRDTLRNSLLDIDPGGATGALIHLTCGSDLPLEAINTIVKGITDNLSPDANVIFGVRQDEEDDTVKILVVLTGVNDGNRRDSPPAGRMMARQRTAETIRLERRKRMAAAYM